MTTENPQEESSSGVDNGIEQIDVSSAPVNSAPEEPTPAEPASSVPQLTLGSGEAPAQDSEEQGEPEVAYQPVIRGRVDKNGIAIGTGRRKTSVARVRIKEGNGKFEVNGRSFEDYFRIERDRSMVEAPLKSVDQLGKVDVWVRVSGGGITGQTGAVVLGISRALEARNPSLHSQLADGGFLTRDGRMVERKKYGKRKARRSFQFSKR